MKMIVRALVLLLSISLHNGTGGFSNIIYIIDEER